MDPGSDDRGRYIKMAMRLEPNCGKTNRSYATWLMERQAGKPTAEWDWSFLEYYRKGVELETDPERKLQRKDIF